ncbi:MAG TPA: ABC transporter permease, partial [Leptospiraceae bacterium]|nr:ABC transporter permease [Leptospiraceae bacterium]
IGFSRGVVPLSSVVFFLSGIFTFLYLTVKSLESRRWIG